MSNLHIRATTLIRGHLFKKTGFLPPIANSMGQSDIAGSMFSITGQGNNVVKVSRIVTYRLIANVTNGVPFANSQQLCFGNMSTSLEHPPFAIGVYVQVFIFLVLVSSNCTILLRIGSTFSCLCISYFFPAGIITNTAPLIFFFLQLGRLRYSLVLFFCVFSIALTYMRLTPVLATTRQTTRAMSIFFSSIQTETCDIEDIFAFVAILLASRKTRKCLFTCSFTCSSTGSIGSMAGFAIEIHAITPTLTLTKLVIRLVYFASRAATYQGKQGQLNSVVQWGHSYHPSHQGGSLGLVGVSSTVQAASIFPHYTIKPLPKQLQEVAPWL